MEGRDDSEWHSQGQTDTICQDAPIGANREPLPRGTHLDPPAGYGPATGTQPEHVTPTHPPEHPEVGQGTPPANGEMADKPLRADPRGPWRELARGQPGVGARTAGLAGWLVSGEAAETIPAGKQVKWRRWVLTPSLLQSATFVSGPFSWMVSYVAGRRLRPFRAGSFSA
jgi:hypothetical protein